MPLNPLVKDIEISGIRKFYNLINGKKDIISFTIGQPDFKTPEHIKRAAVQAIDDNRTAYTDNAGLLRLRESASSFFNKKYGFVYDACDEIIVTAGASQAIDVALRTILSPGDEVILPGPIYPGYEPVVEICGAKAIYCDTRESGFKLTPALLQEKISERTKCIILNYPTNPTGVTLSRTELEAIADILRGRDVFILADEIYSELTEGHFSIASILREQTIVVNGLSKSHAMTGWRIGFLLAPREIRAEILKVHQYNITCATSISQYAAIAALEEGLNDALPMREDYEKRRQYVYERLVNMRLETTYPDGGFYFFVKLPDDWKDHSFGFALDLVEKAKVAVIPGSAFSKYGEGYFRLSYACSMENLVEGLNRLEKYLRR